MCNDCSCSQKPAKPAPDQRERDLNREYTYATMVVFGVVIFVAILMAAADKWGLH